MSRILFILLAVIIGLFVYNTFFADTEVIAGNPAPAFVTENIHGEKIDLADYKGKYVMIDFWGSWCPPCRKEFPQLIEFHNKYKNRQFTNASGIEIITVALEKNDKTWRKVAEKAGFSWRNQVVDVTKFVRLSSLATTFNVTDVPSKFLINPKGEILASNVKFEVFDKILSDKIKG